MDPHGQRLDERSLLVRHVIGQPGSLRKSRGEREKKKEDRKNVKVMQGSWQPQVQRKAQSNLLVTKVGVVRVESAQVSIVRGCGAEEDGGRQVVLSSFEVFVHVTGHTRLNGHSVA